MSGALELRDLTVERGGRAVVRDVSVEIAAGQVTALLGPNGAGKSTLVLAVGGVLRPRSGAVLMDGTDIAGRRPERIRPPSMMCACWARPSATVANCSISSTPVPDSATPAMTGISRLTTTGARPRDSSSISR